MKKRILTLFVLLCISLCGCGKEKFDVSDIEVIDDSSPKETVSNDKVSEEKNSDDSKVENTLMNELAEVEKKQAKLDEEAQDCVTQLDMNMNAADSANLWDDELNSLWSRFSEKADADTKEKVLAEQRQWIKDTEAAVKEAGLSAEGGSIQPLLESCERQERTRKRCYILAGYLAEVLGEDFEQPPRELFGEYVDTQGTMEAYSSMKVNKPSDGKYKVEIAIYRLTSFEGTATESNGELDFVADDERNIKGKIVIDDNDSATFTVTESDWDLLPVGDSVEFPEKWELME